MMRTLLHLCFIATLAGSSVQPGLEGVKKESNLEKRSELALAHADQAIDVARQSYKEQDDKLFESSLREVKEGVELSYQSLVETGKPARNRPKHFKRAEMKMRSLIKRLKGLEQEVGFDHRGPVQTVMKRVQEVHDQLLMDIMTKK